MIAYLPSDFWTVAFWHGDGTAIPKVALRSLVFALPALFAAVIAGPKRGEDEVDHKSRYEELVGQPIDEVPSGLITPFALLVALLTSYRLNNAHGKWETANKSVLRLHEQTRLIISRLCAIFPPTPENQERLYTIRRLLVLACITLEKHIHRDTNFAAERRSGVLTNEEHQHFKKIVTVSADDNKTDTFPSKNIPGLIFFMLHAELHKIFDAHKIATTPARTMVDQDLAILSGLVEELDYLSFTVLPIAYAQLTRLVCLTFLLILPFCANVSLSYGVIPLSIASNLIYFTVDHCASEMEAPFGDDKMDVDVPKMLRRIDKHTASLLAIYIGKPVLNFNLYPETRATSKSGQRLKKQYSLGNVYKMEAARRASITDWQSRASIVASAVSSRCSKVRLSEGGMCGKSVSSPRGAAHRLDLSDSVDSKGPTIPASSPQPSVEEEDEDDEPLMEDSLPGMVGTINQSTIARHRAIARGGNSREKVPPSLSLGKRSGSSSVSVSVGRLGIRTASSPRSKDAARGAL